MAAMYFSELRDCVLLENPYIKVVVVNTPIVYLRWYNIQNTSFIYQSDISTFFFQITHG